MTPAALAALRLQDRLTFPALLATLHREKYTGSVVIHLSQGTPGKVEFPTAPTQFVLDNAAKNAHR